MIDRKKQNKIYVVGLGPGNLAQMTFEAKEAIEKSSAIVGYKPYIAWIRELLDGKNVYESGMRQEIERCSLAIALYKTGESVSVVSGGDAGIYGMAGLVLELAEKEDVAADVVVVPGVSALNAAAALLGAPIMHDFCAVSLSDLLTERETIEKRISLASQGGFIIALYNPRSMGRPDNIIKAVNIILEYRDKNTPAGIVKHAYRTGEKILRATLGDMPYEEIDMNSVVIIGNENTKWLGEKMITPRGYLL